MRTRYLGFCRIFVGGSFYTEHCMFEQNLTLESNGSFNLAWDSYGDINFYVNGAILRLGASAGGTVTAQLFGSTMAGALQIDGTGVSYITTSESLSPSPEILRLGGRFVVSNHPDECTSISSIHRPCLPIGAGMSPVNVQTALDRIAAHVGPIP